MNSTPLPKILLLVTIGIFTTSYGQCQSADTTETFKKYWSIDAFHQLGKVLPTNKFVRGSKVGADPIGDFQAFSVHLAYQTMYSSLIMGSPIPNWMFMMGM